ncbi:hypothetical protein BGZ98_002835 [Dissophora globulifera]|nr:hypothetical protein BGZ98_002835 [Dissophora globulifera]
MESGFQPGLGTPIWSPNLTPESEPQYIGALIGLFFLAVGFRAVVAAQGYLEAYLYLHYYPRLPDSSRHSRSRSHQPLVDDIDANSDPAVMGKGMDSMAVVADIENENGFLDEKRHGNVHSSSPHIGTGPENQQGQEFQGQGVRLTNPSSTSSSTAAAAVTSRRRRYGSHQHHAAPPVYHYHLDHTPSSNFPSSHFWPLPTAQPFVWQAEVSRAVITTAVVAFGYMLMLVVMTFNSAYLGVILGGVFVGEVYFGRWARVRPIFPSSSSSSPYPHGARPISAPLSPLGHAATPGNNTHAMAPAAVASTTSLASRFSSTMHHGGPTDGGHC